MCSLQDTPSDKADEPVDTAILNDSLYHYANFKRDKSLVHWIQNGITLFKENECVELNELKQHLEDAKYRANRLDRPDLAAVIFNFENHLIELEPVFTFKRNVLEESLSEQ